MGLGKTVQAISFLAHLKETGNSKPHLIVVPSSTMDNWEKEIETWCPSLFDCQILRNMVVSSAEDKSLFKKISFHYVVFDEAHMLKNMSTSRYENLMRVKAPRKLLLTGDSSSKQFSGAHVSTCLSSEKQSRSNYEQERIAHAKHIMKPFFLRRLKVDHEHYFKLVSVYKEKAKLLSEGKASSNEDSGIVTTMKTNLRKLANILKNDPSHKNAVEKFIVDDLGIMSDYDIHKTCLFCIEDFRLSNEYICESGKFEYLDKLLPKMKENDDRILLLDGSTPVTERQYLIDDFNQDSNFNPYNDKQAEDRCHRVGQTRPVSIIRLISEGTIEEGIYSVAQEKLKLEQDLTGADDDTNKVKHDVASLLKTALDVEMSDQYIGEVKNYI
ncbi:SMARCAD1 [Lepeophtheirus salmonis]|uniref:SMARCAD1 n=1 Tax=Lepeophtheirus salmonis TaxID=72036 RepID=A0A7R8HCQ9_LEPSM|nr:SMARCAD1 [Lepeophtheirus salmonis]CAF3020731.1 SMARCAD1 [Lepeophtheirus salmonis]